MKATKEKAWANDDLLADIVSICGSDTENEGEKYIFEDDTASEFGGSETGDMYSPADMYSPDGRHEGYVPQASYVLADRTIRHAGSIKNALGGSFEVQTEVLKGLHIGCSEGVIYSSYGATYRYTHIEVHR